MTTLPKGWLGAFVAVKSLLRSMSADRRVCAPNLLALLYRTTSLGSASDFSDLGGILVRGCPKSSWQPTNTAIGSSMRASYTAFDRTMSEWRDPLIRWRCCLSVADRHKYGVPDGLNCQDLKFFVGRINFEQLGKQRADQLNSVPTRFKLAPEMVEMVIAAGRDALRSNITFQAFLLNH